MRHVKSGFRASDETFDVHVNCLGGVHSSRWFDASGRNVHCVCQWHCPKTICDLESSVLPSVCRCPCDESQQS